MSSPKVKADHPAYKQMIEKVLHVNSKTSRGKGMTKMAISNKILEDYPQLKEAKNYTGFLGKTILRGVSEEMLTSSGEGLKGSNRYKLSEKAKKAIILAAKPKKVSPKKKAVTKVVKKRKSKSPAKTVKKAAATTKKPASKKAATVPKSPAKKVKAAKSRIAAGKSTAATKQSAAKISTAAKKKVAKK